MEVPKLQRRLAGQPGGKRSIAAEQLIAAPVGLPADELHLMETASRRQRQFTGGKAELQAILLVPLQIGLQIARGQARRFDGADFNVRGDGEARRRDQRQDGSNP